MAAARAPWGSPPSWGDRGLLLCACSVVCERLSRSLGDFAAGSEAGRELPPGSCLFNLGRHPF